MANGPLKTFFRQDAGMPDDEPDLTDFLLESMLKKAPAMRGGGGMPTSTAPTRMVGARGPQDQQVNVTAPAYPRMPNQAPQSYPMPQMPQQTWGDVLSQVLAGAGDVVSARGGRPTNYLQQAMGVQKGMRSEAFQQAMAQRAAMEQAARLAHEYEWRRYGAGRAEAKQDFYEDQKNREADLYDKMLGKEKEKGERFRALLAQSLPLELAQAEDAGELKALTAKAMRETQGDPDLMAEVQRADQQALQGIMRKQGMGPGGIEKWVRNKTGGSNWWVPEGWLREWLDSPPPGQRFNPYGFRDR